MKRAKPGSRREEWSIFFQTDYRYEEGWRRFATYPGTRWAEWRWRRVRQQINREFYGRIDLTGRLLSCPIRHDPATGRTLPLPAHDDPAWRPASRRRRRWPRIPPSPQPPRLSDVSGVGEAF